MAKVIVDFIMFLAILGVICTPLALIFGLYEKFIENNPERMEKMDKLTTKLFGE